MKHVLTILLIMLCLGSPGQKLGIWLKHYVKQNAPSLLCSFGAGLWSGQMDALQFHYECVKKEFPGIPDQWWNPGVSWTNKYKDNDCSKGQAYFLSTSALCWTTDQWHFAQMQRDLLFSCAIAFRLGEKQKWYFYLVDIVVYSAAYLVGKNISYELYSYRK